MCLWPTQAFSQSTFYRWVPYNNDWAYLYRNNNLIGAWHCQEGYYQRYQNEKWEDQDVPPVPIPEMYIPKLKGGVKTVSVNTNYGVNTDMLKHTERYSHNGKVVGQTQAMEILKSKSLTDDSSKLRLTVIGTEQKTQKVLSDLTRPELKELSQNYMIRSYKPDHWHVAGLFAKGSPAIYLQKPSGEVLLRLDHYPGPTLFAQALRNTDPTYNPENDPDGKNESLLGLEIPTWVYIAGVGLILFFLSRRPRS